MPNRHSAQHQWASASPSSSRTMASYAASALSNSPIRRKWLPRLNAAARWSSSTFGIVIVEPQYSQVAQLWSGDSSISPPHILHLMMAMSSMPPMSQTSKRLPPYCAELRGAPPLSRQNARASPAPGQRKRVRFAAKNRKWAPKQRRTKRQLCLLACIARSHRLSTLNFHVFAGFDKSVVLHLNSTCNMDKTFLSRSGKKPRTGPGARQAPQRVSQTAFCSSCQSLPKRPRRRRGTCSWRRPGRCWG